jgi:DNA-binding Xre family transcriptional regulator
MALAHMLPQRQLTAEELADIVFISGIILNSLPSDGKWLWINLTK